MANAKHTEQFTAGGLRLFRPNLIVPVRYKDEQGKESGDPKYSALLGMSPDSADFAEIKRLVIEVMKAAAFVDADGDLIPLNKLAKPFSLGDKIADRAKARVDAGVPKARLAEHYRGLVVLKASSPRPPALGYAQGKSIFNVVMDDEAAVKKAGVKFYTGAEVWADLTFSPHQVGTNQPGVNAYLNSVLATGKGERIGGGAPPSERFKGYLGQVSGEDPTAGLDDDIGL